MALGGEDAVDAHLPGVDRTDEHQGEQGRGQKHHGLGDEDGK